MSTHPNWPTEAESDRLSADLLANRASTGGEIATAFLTPLIDHLRRKFPTVDPELCETASADAILATIHRENGYNPKLSKLGPFLRMVASRDLLNLLRKQMRHRRGIPLESVAEPVDSRNYIEADEDALSWDDPRLVAEMAAFNPTDLRILALIRAGERGTAAFALILGLPTGSHLEQTATVKRYKERLKKRLTRAVRGAK